MLEDKNHSEQ
jgi:hypothetical protein